MGYNEVSPWHHPPTLKVNRAYRRKYSRDNFAFRFVTSKGFEIDTFAGTVTKDMGRDPDTTIVLALTKSELDEIHETILSTHFFDLPEPHPPFGAEGLWFPDLPGYGLGTIELTVRSGSQYKTVKWDSRRVVGPLATDDWRRLWHVAEQMYFTALKREQYKELPRGRFYVYL